MGKPLFLFSNNQKYNIIVVGGNNMDVRMWVMESFSDEKFQVMDDVELFELLCNIATGAHNYFQYCDVTDLDKFIELKIIGLELEKLWQLSGKLEYVFCYYLSFLPAVFKEDQIHANLTLDQPVPFVENFDQFIEQFDLSNEELVQNMTPFRIALLKHELRNQFVLRYNEECKKEGYQDFLSHEPTLKQKEIMSEQEMVFVYDIYYGVREDSSAFHYPIFLKNENRYIYQDQQVLKEFYDIPNLNRYLVELFPNSFSKVTIFPYQDYEDKREEDYVYIMPLMDIVREMQRGGSRNIEMNWDEKWNILMQIQSFLSRINDEDMIMVNDLLGFAELFATCYRYLYDLYVDFELDQKQMRLIPKN